MWYVEEFGVDEFLVQDWKMPTMTDETLARLITITNTDDWIRGVGHPLSEEDIARLRPYLDGTVHFDPRHSYFAAYYAA